MSRGPGRIEQAVAEILMSLPDDDDLTTAEIARMVFDTQRPDKSERESVNRATKKVALRLGLKHRFVSVSYSTNIVMSAAKLNKLTTNDEDRRDLRRKLSRKVHLFVSPPLEDIDTREHESEYKGELKEILLLEKPK